MCISSRWVMVLRRSVNSTNSWRCLDHAILIAPRCVRRGSARCVSVMRIKQNNPASVHEVPKQFTKNKHLLGEEAILIWLLSMQWLSWMTLHRLLHVKRLDESWRRHLFAFQPPETSRRSLWLFWSDVQISERVIIPCLMVSEMVVVVALSDPVALIKMDLLHR